MKLRLSGNSIRLRLGKSEVQRMLDEGIVQESTTFDISRLQRLEYVLSSAANQMVVTASFEDGRIIVRVPSALVREWAATNQVGIESSQIDSDGGELRILIEKDFQCVDATNESQEDAFPHPGVSGACLPAQTI